MVGLFVDFFDISEVDVDAVDVVVLVVEALAAELDDRGLTLTSPRIVSSITAEMLCLLVCPSL